jgi:uncharacterized membrane protein
LEPSTSKVSDWALPAGLIALSALPIAAGAVRLAQLASGAANAENTRLFNAPLPAVLHISAITLFSVLGALQFAPALRRNYPAWHRWSGRVVVPAGLIAALSGLWLAHFYKLPPHDGAALHITRLVVGVWMTYALVTGYLAIRRRDTSSHQDWMLRGYAIGMGAGWAINAVIAERFIYRRARPAVLAQIIPA